MSKIQINDVKLEGAELFNDSETFFNELEDSELDQIVGGLRIADEPITTVYIPDEPIHFPHPIEPKEPIKPKEPVKLPYPIHPKEPIHFPYPIHPKLPIDYPFCPVHL